MPDAIDINELIAEGRRANPAIGVRVPEQNLRTTDNERYAGLLNAQQEAGLTEAQAREHTQLYFGQQNPEGFRENYRRVAAQRADTERVRQQQRMADDAKERFADTEETSSHAWLSGRIPLVSLGYKFRENLHLGQVQERIRQGIAFQSDHDFAASHQRLQDIQGQRTTGETIGHELATVPAQAIEFYLGGRLAGPLLGAAGRVLGPVGRAAAPLASRLPSIVQTGGAIGGRAVAQVAAQTAATPALWLNQAAERNLEQGRQAYDPRGLPPALTMGMMQTAVLGTMMRLPGLRNVGRSVVEGELVNNPGLKAAVARVLTSTVGGLAEQHAVVEPLAEQISRVLPHAYRLNTGNGLFSNAAQGHWGEAWKQLFVSTATFAAFSGLHELPRLRGGQTQQPARVLSTTEALIQDMATRIPHAEIPAVVGHVDKILDQGGPSLRPQVDAMPEGAAKAYMSARLDTMEAAAKNAAPQVHEEWLAGMGLRVLKGKHATSAYTKPGIPETGLSPPEVAQQSAQPAPAPSAQQPAAEPAPVQSAPQPTPPPFRPIVPAEHRPTGLPPSLQPRPQPPPAPPPTSQSKSERIHDALVSGNMDLAFKEGGLKAHQIRTAKILMDAMEAGDKMTLAEIATREGVTRSAISLRLKEAGNLLGKRDIFMDMVAEEKAANKEELLKQSKTIEGVQGQGQNKEGKKVDVADLKSHDQAEDALIKLVSKARQEIPEHTAEGVEQLAAEWQQIVKLAGRSGGMNIEKLLRDRYPDIAKAMGPEKFRELVQEAQGAANAGRRKNSSDPDLAASVYAAVVKGLSPPPARPEPSPANQGTGGGQPETPGRAPAPGGGARPAAASSATNSDVVGQPQSTAGVLFAPRGGPPGTSGAGTAETTSPFQIREQIKHDVKLPAYEKVTPPGGTAEDLAYLTRQRAAVAGTMAAGDAVNMVHEAAHHIAEKMALDPAQLPQDVAKGFQQFDYVPNRQNAAVAVQEGFAVWLQRRTLDTLAKLTPEQQSASAYAEKLIADAKLTDKVDGWKGMFKRWADMSPIQQAQSLMGERKAYPVMTPGETVQGWGQKLSAWWDDNVTNRLAVLLRAGMTKAYTAWSNLENSEKSLANRFGEEGIGTISDGKWTIIGPSDGKIKEGLRSEDLAKVPGHGDVSKAEVFALARHILYENSQAGKLAPPHPLNVKYVQSGPNKGAPIWEARKRGTVSKEQLDVYQRAMDEFQKDPEFVARATVYADRQRDAFNATKRALSSPDVGRLNPEVVAYYEQLYPYYMPLGRVQEPGMKDFGSRGKEKQVDVYRERKGSAEQVIGPMAAYEKEKLRTAAIMAEQRRRNPVREALLQPGMGEWAIHHPEAKERLSEYGAERKAIFENLFPGAPHEVENLMAALGDEARYFVHEPWQAGKQNLWSVYKNGELENFIIKDRSLYDLLTHQQGSESATANFFKWMGKLGFDTPWGRVEPVRQSAQMVRAGATKLSVAFNLRNSLWPFRDPFEFFKNTIDRASTIRLPEMLKRVFSGEVAIAKGDIPKDEAFNLFMRHGRGESTKMFPTTELPEITGRAVVLRQWVEKATRVLGSGELGPRFLEFVNSLAKEGWSEKRINEEVAKSREAAKNGANYVEPVPMDVLMRGMQAAAEVTVPFGRQGIITREINKVVPFFGPSIAGMSKAIRNWRTNAAGASMAMGIYLTTRFMHWLAYRDEEWYENQQPHDRHTNFVVPIPGAGLMRFPGPRDLEVPAGGFLTNALDGMTRRHTDIQAAFKESFGAVMPPAPAPPVATVAWGLRGNEDWTGRPIVPHREEHMPAMHNIVEHQAPYALQQVTGGRGQVSLRGAGIIPFTQVRNATRPIDDYFQELQQLEAQRQLARRTPGQSFEGETRYKRLHQVQHAMSQLNRSYQTASPEEKVRIRQRQNALARQVMGQ